MAAPPSPARRVLGDKTPNASMKRRGHETLPKQQFDDLMRDEPKTGIRHAVDIAVDMKVKVRVTPRAGQKRRIHEVDGTQDQDHEQHGRDRAESTSPLSVLLTEPNSEADEGNFLSPSQSKDTTSSTLLTSFQPSQEHLLPAEEQFDIQEEMSQRTLDKIHATPLANSTSQLQLPLQLVLATETSQDSLRMSSFIDFASQEEERDNLKMITTELAIHTENRLAKAAMDEKAETLRTRLQLALYKVQTDQINKPFSRLRQRRSSSPELPPQPSSLGRTSPEGIVAAARARATQQKKPAVRSLSAMPIPTIFPTAYSARYMQVPEERAWPLTIEGTADNSHEGVRRLGMSRTPTLSQEDQMTFPKTPMQLSSPRKSGLGGPALRRDERSRLIGGLTSSVVKGEAANGLLELMRAAAA